MPLPQASKRMLREHRLSAEALDYVIGEVEARFHKARPANALAGRAGSAAWMCNAPDRLSKPLFVVSGHHVCLTLITPKPVCCLPVSDNHMREVMHIPAAGAFCL